MSKQEQKESELRKPEKPVYGFFDIDGTLTEGFTIISFAEFLTDKGFFDRTSWEEIQDDLKSYGKSTKDDTAYRKFALDLVNHYAKGMAGQRVDEINLQSEKFFDEAILGQIKGYSILPFSKDLVQTVGLQANTVAISGSPLESLAPLTKYLGFQELRATTIEVNAGVYTGIVLVNLAIDSAKQQVLSEYLNLDIDTENSFAFGDSPHDLPLLQAVGNPFAMGNNSALLNVARERGYEISPHGERIVEYVSRKFKK
ncbi:MAG TPA: haloacid dehalogenase-like hydrolase [Patescibacteria group bacterium]|nr:haloacid dehalogenase-like hydrolase [Patescibacteria group bacterium]